jgi:hypothetical protein
MLKPNFFDSRGATKNSPNHICAVKYREAYGPKFSTSDVKPLAIQTGDQIGFMLGEAAKPAVSQNYQGMQIPQ